MTERTPSTEAGKRLLDAWDFDDIYGHRHWLGDEVTPDVILAIEAEARADALREVGELRAALRDANAIVSMTRKHLAEDHPDCAYEALGVLNDATRAALSQPPAPDPT